MGICFSGPLKSQSSFLTACLLGANSKHDNRQGTCPNATASKVSSVLPTPRNEGEILQSCNLKSFSFSELKMATQNFRPNSVVGGGGFGLVFKGWIDKHSYAATKPGMGMVVAVKRLNEDSRQGHKEWLAEVNYLGQLHHPHLVKLIGYCLEDEHHLLVYEFMPRGSLESHLFRRGFQPLSWNFRMKVALGAAKGLAFLHGAHKQVIYRDFKSSNVLLDSNYNAKLSDFGLARDGPTGNKTHVTTEISGTYRYVDPRYIASGRLSAKSDVHSFGVVLLEMLSGRRAVDMGLPEVEQNLVEWAWPYHHERNRGILQILDSRIKGECSLDAVLGVSALAFRCLLNQYELRPTVEEVVTELEQLQQSSRTDAVDT